MTKNRLTILFALFTLFTHVASAQNTPPSCVITAPYNNAYFQAGKGMTINVYSTDIGGTYANGSISKVEFYNGATKLGDASSSSNNTFSYFWSNLSEGTYTITAKATDDLGEVTTSAGVVVTVGSAPSPGIGISACKGKYLGNIIAGNVPSNYNSLWNGITAENSCKWGSVENTRDVMNWTGANVAYNQAKTNHMMFRYHVFAWGSQFPGWAINSSNQLIITPEEFQAEVEEYISAVATQFPDAIDQIDVLNEQLRTHAAATQAFKTGLGGGGTTGYDWIIWLFTKARQYFPNSKLILNDYGLENDLSAINEQLTVIKLLRDRKLIDGFGTQAHEFNINTLTATQLKAALDLMAKSGVPVYVTEFDISGDDVTQKTRYETVFPAFWEHPAVAGISLWGYEAGKTWKANTELVKTTGSDRPAMTWLKSYISSRPDTGYPFCNQETVITATEDELQGEASMVYPNPSNNGFSFQIIGKFSYELFTSNGKRLDRGEAKDNLFIGENLSNGIYLLVIKQHNKVQSFKLNKN
jgi:GH35 family endo-1,4-beta-xylanase